MAARRRASAAAPGVAEAIDYAEAVVAGTVPAGRPARLACERFLRDKAAAEAGAGPWGFEPDLVEAALLFAGQMPNIKGPEAGRPLRLMPWQKLVFANLFGFVERGTTTRRFRQAVVYVPRGNGKTTLAAPIGLYLTFVEGEGGAEGYAAAVTRDQARILFDAAREMVRRSPGFRAAFGVGVGANAIHQERTASRFAPVSSDAKALDGLNVQVAVCDEVASHKTPEVYDVLLTAMGKRRHPLLLSISTATGNNAGIGKQLWDYAARVLDGIQEDERLFALVHAADPEAAAKTRHLNLWVGADEALFSVRAWQACEDRAVSLDDFAGQPCHIGLDLVRKTDLAAMAIVFPGRDEEGRATYHAFARCYLNESAVLEARNPSYPGWAAAGHLIITPGDETDFGAIEDNIRDLCVRFDVQSVGTDPWQAAHLSQRLRAEGVAMVDFRTTTQNLSPAIVELDAAMRSGRLRHDGNPMFGWCIGNVVGQEDRCGNLFPTKQRDAKIDAAVALLMAIGRAQASEADGAEDITAFLLNPLMG